MTWLIDGNIAEHLRHPRCRIEWTHTDRPPEDWLGTLVEWMGEDIPPVDDHELLNGLFMGSRAALQTHKEKA